MKNSPADKIQNKLDKVDKEYFPMRGFKRDPDDIGAEEHVSDFHLIYRKSITLPDTPIDENSLEYLYNHNLNKSGESVFLPKNLSSLVLPFLDISVLNLNALKRTSDRIKAYTKLIFYNTKGLAEAKQAHKYIEVSLFQYLFIETLVSLIENTNPAIPSQKIQKYCQKTGLNFDNCLNKDNLSFLADGDYSSLHKLVEKYYGTDLRFHKYFMAKLKEEGIFTIQEFIDFVTVFKEIYFK